MTCVRAGINKCVCQLGYGLSDCGFETVLWGTFGQEYRRIDTSNSVKIFIGSCDYHALPGVEGAANAGLTKTAEKTLGTEIETEDATAWRNNTADSRPLWHRCIWCRHF